MPLAIRVWGDTNMISANCSYFSERKFHVRIFAIMQSIVHAASLSAPTDVIRDDPEYNLGPVKAIYEKRKCVLSAIY